MRCHRRVGRDVLLGLGATLGVKEAPGCVGILQLLWFPLQDGGPSPFLFGDGPCQPSACRDVVLSLWQTRGCTSPGASGYVFLCPSGRFAQRMHMVTCCLLFPRLLAWVSFFLPSEAQRRLHPARSLQSSGSGSSREGRSQVRPAAWSVFGDLGWSLKCQHSSLEVEEYAVCVCDEVNTNGILRCRASVSSRRHISKYFVA